MMQTYILVLLTILIVLVIGIVYFGHRQINHMQLDINRNTNNIVALQNLLSHTASPVVHTAPSYVNKDFIDAEATDLDIDGDEVEEDIKSSIMGDNDEEYQEFLKSQGLEGFAFQQTGGEGGEDLLKPADLMDEPGSIITEITEEEGEDNMENDVKNIEINIEKKKKKTFPNESPKDLEVGFTQVSENDGNTYEVVANKNGVKRWKLVKK